MKIFNLEATDMGSNQNEIADKALEIIADREFASENDFYEMEGSLIAQACKELGWYSVPSTGGLLVEWE